MGEKIVLGRLAGIAGIEILAVHAASDRPRAADLARSMDVDDLIGHVEHGAETVQQRHLDDGDPLLLGERVETLEEERPDIGQLDGLEELGR